MKKNLFGAVVGVATLAVSLAACATATDENVGDTTASDLTDAPSTAAVCEGGRFRCFARAVVDTNRRVAHAASPAGLGAKDLEDAYKVDPNLDPGATVAIVDAFGYAKAEADLKVYRAQYGLPACTVANGCLRIVNQDGATSPLPPAPPPGDDWTQETALDLDMASAGCPKCKILLVEANNDQDNGLFLAQATAARLGASVISNSWGGPETALEPGKDYEHFFALPQQVGIFVASGDSGYDDGGKGPDYPSTSAYVTAVGGTRLKKVTGGRGWTETTWASNIFFGGGGGSSCSISIPKPAWQGSTSCSFRAACDVAAVGDPASGPAVYNNGSWSVVGGTSAASPLVAAIYAATGHGKDAPSTAYSHAASYFDVTSGTNGNCGNVLCKAGAGWDGPTGLGTPNGAAMVTSHCAPSCTGKTCGNDGCGGSCGSCSGTQMCSATGGCIAQCAPSCTGRTCGEDGCGGTCGTCASGKTCNVAGQCVTGG